MGEGPGLSAAGFWLELLLTGLLGLGLPTFVPWREPCW